jgi:hypothetical protein
MPSPSDFPKLYFKPHLTRQLSNCCSSPSATSRGPSHGKNCRAYLLARWPSRGSLRLIERFLAAASPRPKICSRPLKLGCMWAYPRRLLHLCDYKSIFLKRTQANTKPNDKLFVRDCHTIESVRGKERRMSAWQTYQIISTHTTFCSTTQQQS